MKNLKKYLLHLLLLLSVTTVTAQTQKNTNRFEVKFGNGTSPDLKSSTALLSADNSISFLGYNNAVKPSPVFEIKIIPTNPKDQRAFTKGYYKLNSSEKRMDYVPGESFNYEVKLSYMLLNDEKVLEEWNTGFGPIKGFVEIESITETRIKGRFSCELLQVFPKKDEKQSAEGTFDLKIIKKN
ncbi:MAG TPA: hypothetical protein PKX92_08955 [Edaphocola sp.]|nr:hypothetical protein [Edaphocola sp.]